MDGLTWVEMTAPEDTEWMWNVMPFREGLVAEGWEFDEPLLLLFDGTEWSSVPIPREDEDGDFGLSRMATSGDELLVLTDSWTETGPSDSAAWVLDANDTFRKVDLPEEISAIENTIGLVGSEEGYVLATSQHGRGMMLWQSDLGDTWTPITDSDSLDDVEAVWNLERHGNKYFVAGQGDELKCTQTPENGTACAPSFGLWSSSDGSTWDRVYTTGGDPVSAGELSSGSLGMAAFGQDFYSDQTSPRAVYLSTDTQNWEHAGHLSLIYPGSEWWWLSRPAIGSDAIVISGMAEQNPADSFDSPEQPFLIVGTVIN
jgi:hypothetical protein